MAGKNFNMIYALQDNNLVHISDVPSGSQCNCFCPACGGKLIAKKGKIKRHHFAHYDSEECQYGYETSLHLAAKQMILQHKKIMIPSVYLKFPKGVKKSILLRQAQLIKVDEVFLERKQENIVPDILLVAEGKKLYVEIYVTHAIDNEKLSKIEKNGISTIEIDLSKCERNLEKEDLEKFLFEDSEKKNWIYNNYANKWFEKFRSVAKLMPIVSRRYALHVDYCPMEKRNWRGKPYANFFDDCNGCEFLIAEEEDGIFCSGEERIADLDDFKKSLPERIKHYSEQANDEKQNLFSKRICPNCGGVIVERVSEYGEFWGCINYPHCRFSASIDKETGEIIIK